MQAAGARIVARRRRRADHRCVGLPGLQAARRRSASRSSTPAARRGRATSTGSGRRHASSSPATGSSRRRSAQPCGGPAEDALLGARPYGVRARHTPALVDRSTPRRGRRSRSTTPAVGPMTTAARRSCERRRRMIDRTLRAAFVVVLVVFTILRPVAGRRRARLLGGRPRGPVHAPRRDAGRVHVPAARRALLLDPRAAAVRGLRGDLDAADRLRAAVADRPVGAAFLVIPVVASDLYLGNIHVLLAAAIVGSLRWPAPVGDPAAHEADGAASACSGSSCAASGAASPSRSASPRVARPRSRSCSRRPVAEVDRLRPRHRRLARHRQRLRRPDPAARPPARRGPARHLGRPHEPALDAARPPRCSACRSSGWSAWRCSPAPSRVSAWGPLRTGRRCGRWTSRAVRCSDARMPDELARAPVARPSSRRYSCMRRSEALPTEASDGRAARTLGHQLSAARAGERAGRRTSRQRPPETTNAGAPSAGVRLPLDRGRGGHSRVSW